MFGGPRLPGVIVFLFALTVGGAGAADTRPPNHLEKAYTALVQDGYPAGLCRKISPRALVRVLFNSPGTQIYRQRSACFFYAAATELNDAYCSDVVEADAWFQDGSYFSPASCRAYVAAGQPWRATAGFDHERLLRAAGFSEEDLVSAPPDGDPATAWMNLYHRFRNRSDGALQQRLDRLPDFSDE